MKNNQPSRKVSKNKRKDVATLFEDARHEISLILLPSLTDEWLKNFEFKDSGKKLIKKSYFRKAC